MTTVTVYVNSKIVFFEVINHEFYIVEASTGELSWFEKDDSNKTGTIKVWLQSTDYTPRLLYVLPDWQLIIDNVWMEKKFYSELEGLEGKTIELRCNNYRFIFSIT